MKKEHLLKSNKTDILNILSIDLKEIFITFPGQFI